MSTGDKPRYAIEIDGASFPIQLARDDLKRRVAAVIKTAGQQATANRPGAGAREVAHLVQEALLQDVGRARRMPGDTTRMAAFIAALADAVCSKAGQTKDHYEMWRPLAGCIVVVKDDSVGVLINEDSAWG